MRILLLIAIALMLYIIIKRLLTAYKAPTEKSGEPSMTADLVQCQYCHLHILAQEAIQSTENAAYYCCIEHQQLDETA